MPPTLTEAEFQQMQAALNAMRPVEVVPIADEDKSMSDLHTEAQAVLADEQRVSAVSPAFLAYAKVVDRIAAGASPEPTAPAAEPLKTYPSSYAESADPLAYPAGQPASMPRPTYPAVEPAPGPPGTYPSSPAQH